MVTCPYCGTNYEQFRSNCKNCGGPMPEPQPVEARGVTPMPPPAAPRTITNAYLYKLMYTDGWSIAGFVFGLLGLVFSLVGSGLSIGGLTAVVGAPFLVLGMVFLAAAGALLSWRYNRALRIVDVMSMGSSALGEITALEQNYSVSIGSRHPWVIHYAFESNGRRYEGSMTTMNSPAEAVKPGSPTYVLYHPTSPQYNALYPHP